MVYFCKLENADRKGQNIQMCSIIKGTGVRSSLVRGHGGILAEMKRRFEKDRDKLPGYRVPKEKAG